MKIKLDIKGMMCSSCVATVEKTLKNLNGIKNAEVSLITNSAIIDFDDSILTIDNIIKSIEDAGYNANIHENINIKKEKLIKEKETLKKKKILITSLILLAILISLKITTMILNSNKIDFLFTDIYINSIIQLIILMPIIILNFNYFTTGFKSLIKLKPNMNALVALGSTISILFGLYALIAAFLQNSPSLCEDKIFFESSAMIIVFVSLGKYIENKATSKTTSVISKLLSLIPDVVTIKKENGEKIIQLEELKENDLVIIKAGDAIPSDGIIVEGYGEINESMLTGEVLPIHKEVNSNVCSGTINTNGFFIYKVTNIGDDSTLNKIVKLIEEASSSKLNISRIADKIAGIFIPIVIFISIITFIVWLIISNNNLNQAFNFAISVLVISCPCSLGLATPVSIMVGVGLATERGILIKSGVAFEKLNKCDVVILDKTGTITTGEMKVNDIVGEQKYLDEIISIETKSNHPLSKAISQFKEYKSKNVDSYEYIPGKGIVASIGNNNYILGNIELLKQHKTILNKELIKKYEQFTSEGYTTILISRNNNLETIISLTDTIRDNAYTAIKLMKNLNKNTVLLTGDNELVANNISKKLEINKVYSKVTPEKKLEIICNYQNDKKIVAMIGDGINDAPSLKKADIGIAIGNGTDIAIDAADIILMNSNLIDFDYVCKLSKRVNNNIKGNLFWAFFYNSIMIPIAAGILYFAPLWLKLNPMIASVAMSLSSICVVLNALRLKIKRRK